MATLATDVLSAALDYASKGMPVFPCDPQTKRPFTGNGFKNATTDPAVIRSWWTSHPDAMVAMPTGEAIGAWVLDVDDPEAFEAACPFELPLTRRCRTGKGYHLYFDYDPANEVRNAQVKTVDGERRWPFDDLPGAEVRGNGGYVIAPPSIHPSGKRYEWAEEGAVAAPPADLLEIVRKRARSTGKPKSTPRGASAANENVGDDTPWGLAALHSECAAVRAAPELAQECTLNEAALKMGSLVAGRQLSRVTARSQLIAAGLCMPSYNSRDPWTAQAIEAKVDRGLSDGAANPRGPQQRGRTAPHEPGHDYPPDGQFDDEPEDDAPATPQSRGRRAVQLEDFHAYMPAHHYIFAPNGEPWPAASVNARIPPIPLLDKKGQPVLDKKGEPVEIRANEWLDKHRPVEQMTWAPGEDKVIRDRLVSDGGWFPRRGMNVFNLYRPPVAMNGDASKAGPWIEHIERIYPAEAEHIIYWLAHRVQRPQEKVNHALVLGGHQGIGKDTILEPVKAAIGPWNFTEVSPQVMLGRFNGFVKSVILRVSEARDLGDVDRFAFYDHMKTYTAAPPDVLRVDEKHLREHSVFNVCGVIITTNHLSDGLYLPADDRRHFVAWSDRTKDQFSEEYWNDLYGWYRAGGTGHVAAYLAQLELDKFNAKAPPPKTPAFWEIVHTNQAPEEAELSDALDVLNWPWAVTIERIASHASEEFAAWLRERRNSRTIPHKLDKAGYVAVRNEASKDGLWKVGARRCAIYAKRDLAHRDAVTAAQDLAAGRR